MFEKRKVTITLLDLICLFIGRVVIWFIITLLSFMILKFLFGLVTIFLSVLTNIWPVLVFITLMMGMILFLIKDDKKQKKRKKRKHINNGVIDMSRQIKNKDLVFIDLDSL